MKSGAVCKTPFGEFTKTMFSSRGKWEREACGRDKEDPYPREWSWESTMALLKVLDLGSDRTIYLEICPATFASAVYFCT